MTDHFRKINKSLAKATQFDKQKKRRKLAKGKLQGRY